MTNPPVDAREQGQVLEAAILNADKLKKKYNDYTIPNAEKEMKDHSKGLDYIKKQMDMVKSMIEPQGQAVSNQESARNKF
jgi:soluble cytochrome b562